MRKRKLLVLLSSMLLLCTLVFTGASSSLAVAATTKASATRATVSPDISCPPEIGYGNTGQWVKYAQESLNAQYEAFTFANYPYDFHPQKPPNWLTVDGIFGINTENATKDFQYAHTLSVDGIIGPHTWHALGWC